jgi:hypothetical protein
VNTREFVAGDRDSELTKLGDGFAQGLGCDATACDFNLQAGRDRNHGVVGRANKKCGVGHWLVFLAASGSRVVRYPLCPDYIILFVGNAGGFMVDEAARRGAGKAQPIKLPKGKHEKAKDGKEPAPPAPTDSAAADPPADPWAALPRAAGTLPCRAICGRRR